MEATFDPENKKAPLYATLHPATPKPMNIDPSDTIGPFYAWKIRQLVLRYDKTKNHTQCVNIREFARDLNVDVFHFFQFLRLGLGARKAGPKEMFCLQGQLLVQNVSNQIVRFITKWVLCRTCNLPEVEHLSKRNTIIFSCRSCGAQIDLEHCAENFDPEFVRYVMTHTEQRRRSTSNTTAGSKKYAKPKSKAQPAIDLVDRIIDRVRKRLDKNESLTELVDYLSNQIAKKKLSRIQVALIVCRVFLNNLETIAESAKTYTLILKQFVGEDDTTQAVLLSFLEELVRNEDLDRQPCRSFMEREVLLLIKQFYDDDVLDEETILAWYEKEPNDEIESKLGVTLDPMCKWLREAEEESD